MTKETQMFNNLLALIAEWDEDLYNIQYQDIEESSDALSMVGTSLSASIAISGRTAISMDHETLITVGYQTVLGRSTEAIDEAGWDYWQAQLDNGEIGRSEFFTALSAGAYNDDFEGERAALNADDREHIEARAEVINANAGDRDDAAGVVEALTNEGLTSPSPDQVPTNLPLFVRSAPDELKLDSLDVTAGAMENGITVQAHVGDPGDVEDVTFTLKQGETTTEQTFVLSDEAGYQVAWAEFDDLSEYEPGSLEITLSGGSGEQSASVSEEFAMYRMQPGYEYLAEQGWLDLQSADTQTSPYDMIGQLVLDFEGTSDLGIGTGFLISPQHVMTSAHVVSDESHTAEFDALNAIDFYPGKDGELVNEGESIEVVEAVTQTTDWSDGSPDGDMAILTLDTPVDHGEHFDWFWNGADAGGERDLTGAEVAWSGYPSSELFEQGDKDVGGELFETFYQWTAEGEIVEYLQGNDEHGGESGALHLGEGMAGFGGASGSPVFIQQTDGSHAFVGIYSGRAGEGEALASTLDAAAFDWALSVIEDDIDLEELGLDYVDAPPEDMGPSWEAATQDSGAVVLQGMATDTTEDGLIMA